MNAFLLMHYGAAAAAGAAGLAIIVFSRRRSAEDVSSDLAAEPVSESSGSREDGSTPGGLGLLNDELGRLGLFKRADRKRWMLVSRLIPVVTMLAAISLSLIWGKSGPARLISSVAVGWAIGYWAARIRQRAAAAAYRRRLEYYLPTAMERIVMAVEAGLDIIAAVGNIVRLEEDSEREALRRGLNHTPDPVVKLLRVVLQLAEAGLRVEKSLSEVAEVVDCSALKHAFVHLALAQKEGGELIMPLRELSDATQLYYQETVEEEIAGMPVKATIPLVLTFAGLIICVITPPLIQVMEITGRAAP